MQYIQLPGGLHLITNVIYEIIHDIVFYSDDYLERRSDGVVVSHMIQAQLNIGQMSTFLTEHIGYIISRRTPYLPLPFLALPLTPAHM